MNFPEESVMSASSAVRKIPLFVIVTAPAEVNFPYTVNEVPTRDAEPTVVAAAVATAPPNTVAPEAFTVSAFVTPSTFMKERAPLITERDATFVVPPTAALQVIFPVPEFSMSA